MQYRSEIDGLRAIAVLPVILFHAGFETFSGGFIGVDVFFVISGYLITSIILSDMDNGTFSLIKFYERRSRRIFPPLFLMLAVAVVAAWFLYLPGEMKTFAQTIAASSVFLTNVYFSAKGGDYFGLDSDNNPLLHLWSLAVEEQYYLIFPVFLLITWRFGKGPILFLLISIATISLGIAQWAAYRLPAENFFLLPSRGWEILLGAVVAVYFNRHSQLVFSDKISQALSLLGLALVLWSVFLFDAKTPFPSILALAPTIGTVLLIVFTRSGTIAYRLLTNKQMVGVGLISYSAYLWHQPLLAFARTENIDVRHPGIFLIILLTTLVLAIVTRVLVENPVRRRHFISRGSVFAASGVLIFASLVFGVVGHLNSGYPERNELFARLVSNYGFSLECNGNTAITDSCSSTRNPKVAIFGNSFAMHLVEGFRHAFPTVGVVQLTQDRCEPIPGLGLKRAGKLDCSEFYARAFDLIVQNSTIETVIISAPFDVIIDDGIAARFVESIRFLQGKRKKVIIVGPTPSNGVDFGKCFVSHGDRGDFDKCNFLVSDLPAKHFRITQQLQRVGDRTGTPFIDLSKFICSETVCNVTEGNTLVYRDYGHLSREGSRLVFEKMKDVLQPDL